MTEIVITSAKRTPIGKFLGSLSNFSAPELGKFALDAVIEESKINKDAVDEVIMGQVLTEVQKDKTQLDKPQCYREFQLKKVHLQLTKSVVQGFEQFLWLLNQF